MAPSWLHRAPPILHELVLCLLCVRPTGQEAAKRGLARGGGGWSRDEPEAGAHEGGSPSPPARFRPPQTLHRLQRSERKTRRRRDGNGQPPAETKTERVEPGGPHTQLRRCGSSETRRGGGAAGWRGPRAARAARGNNGIARPGPASGDLLRDVSTGERPAALRSPPPRRIGVKVYAGCLHLIRMLVLN